MTDSPPTRRHRTRQQVVIWTLGLVVTSVMLGLGLWQMSVFRTQGREALEARMHLPPVPVLSVAGTEGIPRDAYGRPVTADGTFAGPDVLVADPRRPARCRVLSPLRLTNGTILPVVRGVSPTCTAPDRPGDATVVTGIFLPSEGTEPDAGGRPASVRLPRLAQEWDGGLMPGFVSVGPEAARAYGLEPAEVPLPSNAGQARNSGYALQWWIFAAAAVAATIKLSRDAAHQTGLMAPKEQAVEIPVEE